MIIEPQGQGASEARTPTSEIIDRLMEQSGRSRNDVLGALARHHGDSVAALTSLESALTSLESADRSNSSSNSNSSSFRSSTATPRSATTVAPTAAARGNNAAPETTATTAAIGATPSSSATAAPASAAENGSPRISEAFELAQRGFSTSEDLAEFKRLLEGNKERGSYQESQHNRSVAWVLVQRGTEIDLEALVVLVEVCGAKVLDLPTKKGYKYPLRSACWKAQGSGGCELRRRACALLCRLGADQSCLTDDQLDLVRRWDQGQGQGAASTSASPSTSRAASTSASTTTPSSAAATATITPPMVESDAGRDLMAQAQWTSARVPSAPSFKVGDIVFSNAFGKLLCPPPRICMA